MASFQMKISSAMSSAWYDNVLIPYNSLEDVNEAVLSCDNLAFVREVAEKFASNFMLNEVTVISFYNDVLKLHLSGEQYGQRCSKELMILES